MDFARVSDLLGEQLPMVETTPAFDVARYAHGWRAENRLKAGVGGGVVAASAADHFCGHSAC